MKWTSAVTLWTVGIAVLSMFLVVGIVQLAVTRDTSDASSWEFVAVGIVFVPVSWRARKKAVRHADEGDPDPTDFRDMLRRL